MKKYAFIEISIAIFVFLAVIISLFPPFEFGNEKLKTLFERRGNSDIINQLPIKSYDFILGKNKKYFKLGTYRFQKTFDNKDSIQSNIKEWNNWGDKSFRLAGIKIDSFYTAQKKLFRIHSSKMIQFNKILLKMSNDYDYSNGIFSYMTEGDKIIKYTNDPTNKDAINYKEVENEYKKSNPYEWSFKHILKLDSIKKYEIYSITQPKYFLLDRKILLSELLVEYIIAFLVSIILGYTIQKFRRIKA